MKFCSASSRDSNFASLDVVDQIDLRADALGLGLRVILVDADNDTRLLLHIVDHEVQVVADQQEAVDDDQTGNRDADRRKGHEPVLEHGAAPSPSRKPKLLLFFIVIVPIHSVADNFTRLERNDALGEAVDQTLLVRDDQNRRAEGVDLLEQQHDLEGARRVKVARRLVGNDHAGVVDQRARNGNALLLAAGKLVGQAARLVLKTDQLEHIGHALLDLLGRRADHAHRKGDVLIDRLIVDQAEILKDDAQRAAHIGNRGALDLLKLIAVDVDRAAGRLEARP